MGLKNAATASARFGQIKKRLGWAANSALGSGGNATTSRATPKSGSGTNISPSKVTKPRGRPAGKTTKGKGASAPVKDEPENEQEEVKSDAHEADDVEDMKDDMQVSSATEG